MDIGTETTYYAMYLNAPKQHGLFDDSDETEFFEQDKQKAKAAMETAWLKAKPVTE